MPKRQAMGVGGLSGLNGVARNNPGMKPWSVPRTAALAGAVVLAIEALLLATGNGAVLRGTLLDPDCYMHLQRALALMNGADWHGTLDPRINAPYGYTIHWTYLFDLLLVAGATPLRWAGLDAHTALYVWGSAISPLLLVGALGIFAWGVKNQIRGAAFLWLTVLVFTQPQLSGSFLAGRPDHHSLVLGLMLAQLAWAYAVFENRAGPRWAVAAGVLAGLQLVASVEALLTIAVIAAGLFLTWLFVGARTLRVLTLYFCAIFCTVLFWLVWEDGRFLVEATYDRVSIAHAVVLAGAAVAAAAVAWFDQRRPQSPRGQKFGVLAAAAGFIVIVTLLTYPDFFRGPWPNLDPVIVAWHQEITELQPLTPLSWKGLAGFLAQMTAPLLALPLVLYRLVKGAPSDRAVMLFSLLGFGVFFVLSLVQMRWSGELQAVMLLPWTLTTITIMQSEIALRLGNIRMPLRTFALSAALLLQVLPALAAQRQTGLESFTAHPKGACDWSGAARALSASLPGKAIVMAPVWYGPEILWRSDARIIAGPYEMLPALKDTAAFWKGSAGEALAIVRRRGITHALACRFDTAPGFGGVLASGRAPHWAKPVPFKGGPGEFLLYRLD